MNIPSFLISSKRISLYAFVLLSLAFGVSAQKVRISSSTLSPEAISANLDQCRNGANGELLCQGAQWANGNLNFQQTKYAEDQYVPYRLVLTGMTVDQEYTIVLGYDVKNSGAHALDYLGTYNTLSFNRTTSQNNTRLGVNPCIDTNGDVLCNVDFPTDTAPITQDTLAVTNQTNPNTGGTVFQPTNQEFTIWGADGLTFAYNTLEGDMATDAQVERTVKLTFTARSSTVVIAWSGHIGWAGDWGAGNSAGGISGSPYHMRYHGIFAGLLAGEVDPGDNRLKGGNQDRSLSADAVEGSATLLVRKQVFTPDCHNSAPFGFGFTASENFGDTDNMFSLSDTVSSASNPDYPGLGETPFLCDGDPDHVQLPTPGAVLSSQSISIFDGTANVITITEQPLSGWNLTDINCTGNSPVFSENGNQLTVTLAEFQVVTCTFSNTFQGATAAPARIGGQILTKSGSGISGVKVILTDLQSGTSIATSSDSSGYYSFANVTTETLYSLSVSSKLYRFKTSTQTFMLDQDMLNMNFVGK